LGTRTEAFVRIQNDITVPVELRLNTTATRIAVISSTNIVTQKSITNGEISTPDSFTFDLTANIAITG